MVTEAMNIHPHGKKLHNSCKFCFIAKGSANLLREFFPRTAMRMSLLADGESTKTVPSFREKRDIATFPCLEFHSCSLGSRNGTKGQKLALKSFPLFTMR